MAEHTPKRWHKMEHAIVRDPETAERLNAAWNAFHSPDGREIATEKITPGLFWTLILDAYNVLQIAKGYVEEYGPTPGEEGGMELAYIGKLDALLAKLEDTGQ